MNLQGERIIPASVERTWTALNDPETLMACIAGCESIETTGENEFLATMAVRIGPVNARFKGKLKLSDIVPMQSYRINFDGQGGVAGFGKGSADVTLAPEGTAGDATRLTYKADAQVGGKIAQIGSRLVESAAAKIAEDFFKAFEARMTAPAGERAATGSEPENGPQNGPGNRPVNRSATGAAPDAALAADASAGTLPGAGLPPPTIDAASRAATAQATPSGGAGNSIWWIAGIIVLALLAYFFTR